MSSLKNSLSILQKKAKERTVKTQNIEYDLETLVKKIDKNVIKLDPEYQRKHRWDDETASKLIESLILNIPIPIIYISQDVDVDEETDDDVARYSVIDGQQRLTSIYNFMNNHYPLTELKVLKELNNCFYKDLPPFLIRRLEERTIKCLRIDSTVDPQVKYDIFERLNSGSVKLEPQELRNAVSRGAFNDLIKKLAQDTNFRVLIRINPEKPEESKKVKKMEDVELVLRFFALSNNNYLNYKQGFKDFLSEQMDRFNKINKNELAEMELFFVTTMQIIRTHFGDNAFAKFKIVNRKYKLSSNFNAAVYDALAIGLSTSLDVANPNITDDHVAQYKLLFNNEQFFQSVSGSVNDREKIVYRIEQVKRVFG